MDLADAVAAFRIKHDGLVEIEGEAECLAKRDRYFGASASREIHPVHPMR